MKITHPKVLVASILIIFLVGFTTSFNFGVEFENNGTGNVYNYYNITNGTSYWTEVNPTYYSIEGEIESDNFFSDDNLTFFGHNSGYGASGSYLTGIGAYSLMNSSGIYNQANGFKAGQKNTANYNIFIGRESGYENSADDNTFIGYQAGYQNIGFSSVGIGKRALYGNKQYYSTAIGYNAGRDNSGSGVNFIGSNSGHGNLGGSVIGIGSSSLFENEGYDIAAIGEATGFQNVGDGLIAIGYGSGLLNEGEYVTSIGYEAGVENTGDYSVFIGEYAGTDNEEDNVFILMQESINYEPLLYGNFTSGQINVSEEGDFCITNGNCLSSISPSEYYWNKTGSNLYYTDGFVGIGTTPTEALEVDGNVLIRDNVAIGETTNISSNYKLLIEGDLVQEGIYIKMDDYGSTSTGRTGINSKITHKSITNPTGSIYAGYFGGNIESGSVNSIYGVYGNADSEEGTSTNNYGGYFTSNAGTNAYGIYASAEEGTNNWAGYFDEGDVYIKGNLHYPNIHSNIDNSVLIVDEDGIISKDEIDSRVWGSSLIDGSGASGHIPYYSDSNTITYDNHKLLWDSTNNKLSINTNVADSHLNIVSEGDNVLDLFRITDNNKGAGIRLSKSRGIVGSEEGVIEDDIIGQFNFRGYGTNGYKQTAKFGAKIDEGTISDSSMPGYLYFSTTPNGASKAVDRMYIRENGNVGIGTSTPTTLLDINSARIRIRDSDPPSSASDTGAIGEIAWDTNYIYVCTATNTWKRTGLSTW